MARSNPSGMVARAAAQVAAQRNDRRPQGYRTRLTDSLRLYVMATARFHPIAAAHYVIAARVLENACSNIAWNRLCVQFQWQAL